MNRKIIFSMLALCAAILLSSAQADAKKISGSAAASQKARSLIKGGTVTEIDRDR